MHTFTCVYIKSLKVEAFCESTPLLQASRCVRTCGQVFSVQLAAAATVNVGLVCEFGGYEAGTGDGNAHVNHTKKGRLVQV